MLNCVSSDRNIEFRNETASMKSTKHRFSWLYLWISRITLVLLVFGILITTSVASDGIPSANSLVPDQSSPQTAGTSIAFIADATDPDGDPLLYRFWLKGPSTANKWVVKQDWSSNNAWTWATTDADIGKSEISTWIRDGNHADKNGFDGEAKVFDYIIKKAKKEQVLPVVMAIENQPPIANSLNPNKASPQTAGASVTFNAVATDPDGDSLLYRFWLKGPSTANKWVVKQDWSSSNAWTWSTGNGDVGSSEISVWVRDGKHANADNLDSEAKVLNYIISKENLPPTVNSFTPDRSSPQVAGTTIRWTVDANDPDGDTILYRYWLKGPSTGNVWKVIRDWTSSNTWTWTTKSNDVGEYDFCVYVRDGKHQAVGRYDDCTGYKDYQLISAVTNQPPVVNSLNPNRPSPQVAGTTITWTANAYDRDGDSILYRFWLRGPSTGNVWKVIRDWSTSNTWTWFTDSGDAGEYDLYVYVRDGKHRPSGSYDSGTGYGDYRLTSEVNLPPELTSLNPNRLSPLATGSTVTWTADAYDADSDLLLYKFWLRGPSTGNVWTVVRDWSPSNTWTWDPSFGDAGEYDVYVYLRDGKHRPSGSYDSALGYKDYQLVRPLERHQLTFEGTTEDRPALVYSNGGYLLAYQSWEKGRYYWGDIFLKTFDLNWDQIDKVWATDDGSYQDSPAAVYSNGYYYVPYVSNEMGNFDIFVKKYDSFLNLIETRKLTTSTTDQDRPSLIKVGNYFYLAYQSWERGTVYGGDVFVTQFDSNWNPIKTVWATTEPSYQDSPSLTYANGNFYVAYASEETGNLDIFVKKYDSSLNFLDKKRLTYDSSNQDHPSIIWQDDEFALAYTSSEGGNYDVYLDRYDQNWNLMEKVIVTEMPGDQTWPSLTYSPLDGLFWIAYVSQESADDWNIFVQPVDANGLYREGYVFMDLSSTKAYNPYDLDIKFYDEGGLLVTPSSVKLTRSSAEGTSSIFLAGTNTGTYQFDSKFGSPGVNTFTVVTNIEGQHFESTMTIEVS